MKQFKKNDFDWPEEINLGPFVVDALNRFCEGLEIQFEIDSEDAFVKKPARLPQCLLVVNSKSEGMESHIGPVTYCSIEDIIFQALRSREGDGPEQLDEKYEKVASHLEGIVKKVRGQKEGAVKAEKEREEEQQRQAALREEKARRDALVRGVLSGMTEDSRRWQMPLELCLVDGWQKIVSALAVLVVDHDEQFGGKTIAYQYERAVRIGTPVVFKSRKDLPALGGDAP